MMLCFSGLERQVEVLPGMPATLEVHNRTLFERICRSLLAESGETAAEPYVLCDDDEEVVSSRGRLLVVESPFSLPWGDRALGGAVTSRVVELLHEDPEVGDAAELLFRQIASSIAGVSLQLQSDYAFAYEWDVPRYLKAFGFGVEAQPEEAVFDNCIRFLSLAQDMRLKKLLVFFNLKLFLSENEVEQVFERVFFANLPVLFIENMSDKNVWPREKKYIVDQHFLES